MNIRLSKVVKRLLCVYSLLFTAISHASFIETTMGTAVVNDATATFYNPAALTLLKKPQIIGLGSYATLNTHFSGETIQNLSGLTQSGAATSQTNYYLPSIYMAFPSSDKLTVGLAIVSNFFNNSIDDTSVLRYNQSGNRIKDIDINPALGLKLNKFIALGAGLSISSANFLLEPVSGFPTFNIPDTLSRNDSSGVGLGYDIGALLYPSKSMLIGFNYRSSSTYHLSGTSTFESRPAVVSRNYHFNFFTPSKEVLTIGQLVTPDLGLIATVQYIQWNIFNEINIHGIATRIGTKPVIVDATVPYHFHNSWLVTLGAQYQVTTKWIVRAATTYNQSPTNTDYQIGTGDSIILGASTGYEILKNIIVDASYAHAFIQNADINIATKRSEINGVNSASRDSVSLKLTFNL